MMYEASIECFESTFMDAQNKFRHKQGKRFKLFPFKGNNNAYTVENLDYVAGSYLSGLNDKAPGIVDVDKLIEQLFSDIEVRNEDRPDFIEVVKHLCFDDQGDLLPLNARMLAGVVTKEDTEKDVADYLVDVLGDRAILKQPLTRAYQRINEQSNVLERTISERLTNNELPRSKNAPYNQVITSLQKKFEEDFSYIIENRERTREYFISLLELYYFTYTVQACFQLDLFVDGARDKIRPLYFCLEWEATNQSRKCYNEGWRSLEKVVKHAFIHAVVLEILNQTSSEIEQWYDYLSLQEWASVSEEEDTNIAEQIATLTDKYRSCINDCPAMDALTRESAPQQKTAAEIRFLFNSVRTQFDNTGRGRVCNAYSEHFLKFAKGKFGKLRGRSGWLLNLSEEMLIFLLKLCVKNEEQTRLNTVFDEFEARGIFLDPVSKRNVAEYYERLNLIEKKSDSGDAMYVKRIL